jgi:hypothetical protein
MLYKKIVRSSDCGGIFVFKVLIDFAALFAVVCFEQLSSKLNQSKQIILLLL